MAGDAVRYSHEEGGKKRPFLIRRALLKRVYRASASCSGLMISGMHGVSETHLILLTSKPGKGGIYRRMMEVIEWESIDTRNARMRYAWRQSPCTPFSSINQAPSWSRIIPLFSVIFWSISPAPLSTKSPAIRHPHSSASASEPT